MRVARLQVQRGCGCARNWPHGAPAAAGRRAAARGLAAGAGRGGSALRTLGHRRLRARTTCRSSRTTRCLRSDPRRAARRDASTMACGAILAVLRRRTRRRNLAGAALLARVQLRERIVLFLGFRILRDRDLDLVRVDVDDVAVVQLVRLGPRDAMVRRVDEDTVGAGVLDEVLAVQIADQGVPARDVRIRKHPVVVRQAADGAADGVEDLAAAGAEVLRLLADDFQRKDHGVGLFPRSAEALIVQRLGASQYRPEGRNNNEYYRPLQRRLSGPDATGITDGQAMTGQRRQPDKRRDFAAFCGRGGLVRDRRLGGRAAGHGGLRQRAGRRGLAPVHDLGGLPGHWRRAGRRAPRDRRRDPQPLRPEGQAGRRRDHRQRDPGVRAAAHADDPHQAGAGELPASRRRGRHTGRCCTSIPRART